MNSSNSSTLYLSDVLLKSLQVSAATKIALQVVGGVMLLALFSKIQIPLQPVPITLQTMAVMLIAATYGPIMGTVTVATYWAAGIAGIPVFAVVPGGSTGTSLILGPTAGYLIGFVFAAAWIGTLSQKRWDRNWLKTGLAFASGHVIIFFFGVLWLAQFTGFKKAIVVGVLPFLIGDVVKIAVAMGTLPSLWKLAKPEN
jgi:biotin transport system substrate-specific component